MRRIVPALCLAGLAGLAGTSAAEPVYRCGNTYSHTPCTGGRIVEATDPRSAAQRAEARRIAAQERRRAAAMERERRALERGATPTAAAGIRPPPATGGEAPRRAERPARAASSTRDAGRGKADSTGKVIERGNVLVLKPRPPRAASAPDAR